MKKIYKILLAFVLSLALFAVPSERQYVAHAQGMPTIDVSNLLQNILDFLTNLDSFDIDQETVDKLRGKLEQYGKYIEMFQSGVQAFTIVSDIAKTGEDIVNDLTYMLDCVVYFNSIGAQPSICLAAMNCYKDFKQLTTDIQLDYKKIIELFRSNRNGAEINLLLELDNYMNTYRAKIQSLSWHYRGEMSRLYQKEMYYRQAVANRDFRKLVVY